MKSIGKTATYIGLIALALLAACARKEAPVGAVPAISLDCTLHVDESYSAGKPVTLKFELHNPSERTLYVLNWYTPLEGIAGEIFKVTRDSQELPYQGMLAKRGDPSRDEYVAIEPGEAASAKVDLGTGYDLSATGSYQVQFTAGLQDVTDDGALVPRARDEHRPQPLDCDTVKFDIRE